ncbi:radical SAM protein [Ferroplasma sp.]|uniref:radical SAM protein n=1 Tax=Ferroplasma sp. TaxID=2591003 RepID=UPI00307EFDE8
MMDVNNDNLNKKLELIILPTEDCNFRCVYCYEHFEIGKMKENVVKGIKNLILERGEDLEQLIISWFGGEPLLAFSTIREIMQFAKYCASKYGFEVVSSMTTNGSLLTEQRQKELDILGVTTFQISFDGDSNEHNKLRVTRNNTGTYDLIYRNLQAFHRSNLKGKIILRIHANANNFEGIIRQLKIFASDFSGDCRFKIFFFGLEKLGGKNDATIPVIDGQTRYDTIMLLKKKAKEFELNIYESFSETGKNTPMCYASSLRSYVIRSNGEIGKCTVALYDSRNSIGYLTEDGKIHLDTEKLKFWVRGQFNNSKEELLCPYYAPKGGTPISNIQIIQKGGVKY